MNRPSSSVGDVDIPDTPLQSRPATPNAERVRRHPTLWFEDGNITLQIDDTLFKLHKSLLAKACAQFQDTFAVGVSAVGKEGTDEHPLLLGRGGPTLAEFTVLCRAIYATWGDDESIGTDDLVRLLRAADFYRAHEIHSRAVEKLNKKRVSLVDRIVYAREFAISGWETPAFVALVQTLRTPTDDEARRLGWALAFRVVAAQKAVAASRADRLQNANQAGCCSNCQSNYVRNQLPQVAQLLTSEPPASATQDIDGYLKYLRGQVKYRCPNVGGCGNQSCQTWPSVYNIRTWFELSAEEETIKKMLD